MVVMVIVLSAAIIVSFGNQALLIGSETNSEAVSKAQGLIESTQAIARKDFNLVNPVASTTDGIYEKAVYVSVKDDGTYLTKEVKALIAWTDEKFLKRSTYLATLVTNFETPVGNDTCSSTLSGDWTNPAVINGTTDFAQLVGDAGSTYTLSDVDAYRGKLYVTAGNTSAGNKETLFIFNITNPTNPTLMGKIDNEGVGGTVQSGPYAVKVSGDPVSGKTFAYLANGNNADYNSCTPGPRCAELQIADVSNAAAPAMYTNLMIASTTSSVPKVNGVHRGTALYYRNGYLMLGLTHDGSVNDAEFHLLDMHSVSVFPAIPAANSSRVMSEWISKFTVANDVNALVLRGIYAYLASPNSAELQILSLANPLNPTLAGSFNAASGGGNGKSLYLIGDTLYFGKTVPNAGSDVHIIDVSNHASPVDQGPGIDLASSANGVITRDYLSFILTNTDLRAYRTDNPATPTLWGSVPLSASGSTNWEPSLDCEGNYLYAVSNNVSDKGSLSVITSQ